MTFLGPKKEKENGKSEKPKIILRTVVHAALDPLLPVDHQPSGTLIWGHADFGKLPRQDGQWVVHGHTIVDAPRILDGVISVDTGAYATGRLTMARITPDGQVSFSTAQPSGH